MKRHTQSKAKMRRGLISLLQHEPLEEISVTALCKAADINRTTFYLHYRSVSDVWEEAIASDKAKILSFFKLAYSIETVEKAMFELCEYLKAEVKDLIALYKNRAIVDDQELRDRIYTLVRTVQKGQSSMNEEATKECVRFYLHGTEAVIRDWVRRDFPYSSRQVAALLINLSEKIFL